MKGKILVVLSGFGYWGEELIGPLEKIEAARIMIDQHERLALYRQADKILMEEALLVPLRYILDHFIVSPRILKFPLTLRWRDFIVDTQAA